MRYLDYHATTPVDRRVCDAMLPFFCETFGNPSSKTHAYGWDAADAVQQAREQVARLVGATAREVCFTSGGSEANNLALQGVARASRTRGDHIVTVATEHSSVIDTARYLQEEGFRVTFLPVQPDGLIDLDRLQEAIDDRTIVVSVMAANNEIGVLQPISEAAAIAASRGVTFHTDAVQAAGKIPFNVSTLGVDLASLSAHKIYGPKGVGALVVRRRKPPVAIAPLLHGGKHEHGLRSGTLNVPGIVGFGKAAELCAEEAEAEATRLRALRDRLLARLRELDGVVVNGSLERRLPHNLNVGFERVEPEALLMSLGDIAVSTGSACASASEAPSHVLTALGVGDDLARASIRFGLGRFTTDEDVDVAADRVVRAVTQLREKASRLGIGR
ncbi:MAG TPA: IscS subfamily cysteine desulfurase [Vicinamibacterales bacterium]|nr:IscS subfamily cysteine desulfurase [Vicinamibacterales bacterium]